MLKSAKQGNGEYNQSISPGSLLIEIGGTNNTPQESQRAAEALADVLAKYYHSKE
ncbi:stage II sporulation protein P [Paenibacillus sp. D2_2]|uniref:stage II sporulation protein P n=1 Tax=Paenibacillus sp. D2_2 TaxID=3073092 RepID=UPI0035C0277F